MKWLRGPYEPMSTEEREALATEAALGDPVQAILNNEALKNVGQVISVRPRAEGEDPGKFPAWVVYNIQNDNVITFMGIGVEGGDTREEAFKIADRIGYKNDMSVVDLEATDEAEAL